MIEELNDVFAQMDTWSLEGIPFFFLIDFDGEKPILYRLSDFENSELVNILFEFPNIKLNDCPKMTNRYSLYKQPISFQTYKKQFESVLSHLHRGDTFLVNLTCETPIETDVDLLTIFEQSEAQYKILLKDKFVCFSPETFVKITNNKISTYPMKGTIDASAHNAESIILNDPKEMAEHATIVDLLRNDLSMVATNVEVSRYIDKVKTTTGELLQVSSEIEGELQNEYIGRVGTILSKILPAGSVTGAPKTKTIEIIKSIEEHNRGFYTGISGVYDGRDLDTCVLIRFIEQRDGKLYYKSGGGITSKSVAEEEYNEMINKVYVPRMD